MTIINQPVCYLNIPSTICVSLFCTKYNQNMTLNTEVFDIHNLVIVLKKTVRLIESLIIFHKILQQLSDCNQLFTLNWQFSTTIKTKRVIITQGWQQQQKIRFLHQATTTTTNTTTIIIIRLHIHVNPTMNY